MTTAASATDMASAPGVPAEIVVQVQPALADALASWLNSSGATLTFDRWIAPGLSGAQLASVALKLEGQAARGLLLKFCPPGRLTGKEASRHAEALADAPPFAAAHLVEQPHPAVVAKGGWSAMFQAVAGGTLRDVRPVSTLRGQELPTVLETVVRSVLEEWNADADVERAGPLDLFRHPLGTRVDKGGPVQRLGERILYDDEATGAPPWIKTRSGKTVPNPVSWALHEEWLDLLRDQHVMAVKGRAHGDFHADNILIPMRPFPDPSRFALIDLAGYSSSAPLASDPVHLLLSVLVAEARELTESKRDALTAVMVTPGIGATPLQLAGLAELSKRLHAVGEAFASNLGWLDHWRDQTLVLLAANALLFAARLDNLGLQQWCLEVSGEALAAFAAGRSVVPPTHAPAALISGLAPAASLGAVQGLEELGAACGGWAAGRTTILVIDSSNLPAEARSAVSRLRWNVVVDLNSRTDVDGGWAEASGPLDRRLFTKRQEPFFGRSSTVWLAGAGLSDVEPVDSLRDLRKWRSTHHRFVASALARLAEAATHPATIVCVSPVTTAARAVVEAALDAFGDRLLVTVVGGDDDSLKQYGASYVRCDAAELLLAVPEPSGAPDGIGVRTLPGKAGPVRLDDEMVGRYSDAFDLLHSSVGLDAGGDVGGFYRGRPINWHELDIGLDVERQTARELVSDLLRPSLQQRSTLRVTLAHLPGAGGTTVARRAAWDLKDEFPTMYVRGSVDEAVLVQAVGELARLSELPVLIVAELVPDLILKSAFEALRASSVPAVLLITTRRSTPRNTGPNRHGSEQDTERRGLSIRLGALTKLDERRDVAARFAALAPTREAELFELAARATDNNVPFFYALTAFGADFEGLTGYVSQFLMALDDHERELLLLISLCHYYCGLPLPADVFAELLDVPPSESVDLLEFMKPERTDLLVEEPVGAWRITHALIAEEVLRQVLAPAGITSGRDDWKASLPALGLRFIGYSSAVFGRRLPVDVKSIVDRLFTTRERGEAMDGESGGAATYTDLMQEMSSPGRLQILKALVAAFPEEPHYWAHLGRMLSYDVSNFVDALSATDRAIALSPRDPLLHHMRGMVFRNEMRARIRERGVDARAQESRVLELCQAAGDAFRAVSELDDTSEFGHVALAQANVAAIEFGQKISGAKTFAEFLAKPTASQYRDLLADAEESLDAAREIRGADRASYVSEAVQVQLAQVYDDYSALLQGWRNLLERPDLAKPPIRRRLARTYRLRAGSWRQASAKDVKQAVALLDDNLVDNPLDGRSLLEWLQAARFTTASLDQAADLIAGWARAEGSREALFYDYVLAFLRAMDGAESAVAEYHKKVERCRERAAWFGHRRYAYEWLGAGTGLGRLVHHADLAGWERRSEMAPPVPLARAVGRVQTIDKPTAGTIDFGSGLTAFVVPTASELLRGRDENARINAYVAFRYDGPMAQFVKRVPAGEPARVRPPDAQM